MDELAKKINRLLIETARRLHITRVQMGGNDDLDDIEIDLRRLRVMWQTYQERSEAILDRGA